MRTGISFTLSATDRKRLRAISMDPKSPQKHVWRARIVLLSGDGVGTTAIMAATGKSKTCVWRWQERFCHDGVDGLLTDRTRPPGIPPIPADRVAEIVRLTHEPPPHEATHWTVRAMAEAAGVAASTVQGIWKAHGLSPQRWRAFKLSRDPAFGTRWPIAVSIRSQWGTEGSKRWSQSSRKTTWLFMPRSRAKPVRTIPSQQEDRGFSCPAIPPGRRRTASAAPGTGLQFRAES